MKINTMRNDLLRIHAACHVTWDPTLGNSLGWRFFQMPIWRDITNRNFDIFGSNAEKYFIWTGMLLLFQSVNEPRVSDASDTPANCIHRICSSKCLTLPQPYFAMFDDEN